MIQYEDFLKVLPQAEDKGKYILGVCPFHSDNSPSLLVFKDGWFLCLAADCSVNNRWVVLWNRLKGQPIRLVPEHRLAYNVPEAIRDFESREDMAYEAHRHLVRYDRGWYLEMRGLGDAIEMHELGYWRGWYTFPVWGKDYSFENVVFRTAPHLQIALDGNPRYWADGKPSMYVPDWHLLNKGDYIVVVFGIMDALTLNKFRFPVVTPTHGHIFDPNWLGTYRKPIFVIPDKGEEKAGLHLTSNLGWRGRMIRLDWPDGMKDANDFLKAGKQDDLLSQLDRRLR